MPLLNGVPDPASTLPGTTEPDMRRRLVLTCRRRCALCGCAITGRVFQICRLPPEDPAQASHFLNPGNVWLTTGLGPIHKSCAVFSTSACRYLRFRASRKRFGEDNLLQNKRVTRGDAAIVGFQRYGLDPEHPNTMAFWNVTEIIQYDSWKELTPVYDDVLATEQVDVSTRLYWDTTSPTDLIDRWNLERVKLATARPFVLISGEPYRICVMG